ncbi:hypothetical protein BP5796_07021 [Coleophoma crateriformis]|uniref:JmjC domain-containing protein n=1 Tax=Coleophoma crateriformis TaxID=565419 RepID=A0A3D8RQG0_9HELO|nr:hypothetical protein BP5796_07021 [Coleophoma crateriformis]
MADGTCSEAGSDITSSSSLQDDIRALAESLYHAWSSNTPLSTLTCLRDQVLASRSRVDVQILTLSSVAQIACPPSILGDDPRWSALFSLARACAVDSDPVDESLSSARKKRKRTNNAASRVRNLALVASLWSPSVVDYYGWASAGNAQINGMRACALRWPRFVEDFCPRLNAILLQRHCEALSDSRVRGLNEAALQPLRDFNIAALEAAVVDLARIDQWTQSNDGAVPVDQDGSLLNRLRPHHFRLYLLQHDRYGMLVARNASSAPPSPHTEASLSPFPLSPFASYATGSVSPGGHEASNVHAVDVSLTPSPPNMTFASTNSLSNASSSGAPASPSIVGPWDTPPTCAIDSGPGEELEAGQEACMGQAYRHSPPQLTLDPAVLSLRHSELCLEPMHDSPPAEPPRLSEPSHREPSPPCRDPTHISAPGSPCSRPHLAVLRPALPPAPVMVSNEKTKLTVDSRLVPQQGLRTVEEALHNKYRSTIIAYAERIFQDAEPVDASSQRKLRAQWLTKKTAWASYRTRDNAKHSTRGEPSYEEADVLYLTSDEFITAAHEHKIFDKPMVIKESFSDSGMHTVEGLAAQLMDTSPHATIDVITLDGEQPERMSIQDFVSCSQPDRSRTGCSVKALNLRNVTKAHRPLFTMLSRFRLLETLADRVQGGSLSQRTGPLTTDVAGRVNFNVLGTVGAFAGPQLNALSGTWVRNLDGVKLWMMVPESAMDAAEWEAFGKQGSNWVPRSGSKLLVLEPDDVLLMPPGSKIVHAVHSLTDDVMEWGMLWDDLNVIATLQAILWIGKHQMATHEGLAHQLPRIINELGLLVRSQIDRFCGALSRTEFLDVFDGIVSELKGLGCQCGSRGCGDECSCRRLGRRCTAWCLTSEENSPLACAENP